MADRATATGPQVAGAPRRPGRVPAPVLAAGAASVALVGLWLAAPPMGTDLSAQVARADFFAAYGWAPLDLRWYGGVAPYGYSLVTPPLMAWFGPGPVGAAAAVVSSLALAWLLVRTGTRRPLLGGVLGAACFAGNLVSGRVTFAAGVALGLLALVALVVLVSPAHRAPEPGAGVRSGAPAGPAGAWAAPGPRPALRRVTWLGTAGVLAVLAAAASPVAGLFVGLAGTALVVAGRPRRPRPQDPPSYTEPGRDELSERPGSVKLGGSWVRTGGAVLVVGAAVPVAVMGGWFGSGGWMNMSHADMLHASLTGVAVALLVPRPVVRAGALLSAAGVVAAYLVHTPVGLNATRLATMFALPVVAACAVEPSWLRRWHQRRPGPGAGPAGPGARQRVAWLAVALVALAVWQPPVIAGDLAGAGDPAASPAHFASLRAELDRREAGRVEVVPTEHYWESAHLDFLARGWLRQVDLDRNRLFFDGSLDPESYRLWLVDNGVSHVAVPAGPVSWVGGTEAELIEAGLPYLTVVWSDPDWTLYEVAGRPAVVEGPARLAGVEPDRLVVEAGGPGEILVRLRWSRWLAVSGPAPACLEPAGAWITVRLTGPGTYRLTGSVLAPGPRC
jgi:hypothetical protein